MDGSQQPVKAVDGDIVASGLVTDQGFFVVAKRGGIRKMDSDDPLLNKVRPGSLGQVSSSYTFIASPRLIRLLDRYGTSFVIKGLCKV